MNEIDPDELSDEEIVGILQNLLKKYKNLFSLNDFFSHPDIDRYFKIIYGRYRQRIEAYCSKFIFESETLSDIYHDIFIKIYLNIHKFKKKKSFKAWIYSIARNSCLNYLRNHKYRELPVLNKKNQNNDEFVQILKSADPHLEQKMHTKQIREFINDAVTKLPYPNRNVYILKTEENLTFHEISHIENISLRNAKSLFHNALTFIKNYLTERGVNYQDLN